MFATTNVTKLGETLEVPSTPLGTQVSGVGRPHTYSQILKSSVLIGSSSMINIGIGILRTKAMAVLLGPAGYGLMGLYSSVADLAQSVAGMGINSSGVRQIAEAVGSGERLRIARTTAVLRRIAVVLGILGAALLVAFSDQISTLTFGTKHHSGAVALLSLAVFFGSVSAGQAALVQGMRRITDLARMSVLAALLGTLISVPVIYFLREKGVVPSLVTVAAMLALTSWYYSHKIQVQPVAITTVQFKQEVASLLKLGFAFMASGFLTLGAAYAIRMIVVRRIGYEAAGFYQSAWTLGGLYVGFILQAMGADFYPRLTAHQKDNDECNLLVNEQAQISLLLAGPGVIATLTFAPLVIALFYSGKFGPAVDILRWICLGMTLRVVVWPMGFIVLAKGRQKIFFWTEVAATIVHVGLAWLCVVYFGLTGAGIAFVGLYCWHGLLIYIIARRLSGFRWSAANRRIGLIFLTLIVVVFCGRYLLPDWVSTEVGAGAVLASCIYSIRFLLKLVSTDRIPPLPRRLLIWLRLASSTSV